VSISVAPGTLARRALQAIADTPGERTCADLAAELIPAPRHGRPFTSSAEYRARGEALAAHRKAAEARMGRLLSRLHEQGLIEPRGDLVALAPWAATRIAASSPAALLAALTDRGLVDPDPDDLEDADEPIDDPPSTPGEAAPESNAVDILTRLAVAPTPCADLMRRASGTRWLAYRRLAEEGVIVAPSHRWPTPAGLALLAS